MEVQPLRGKKCTMGITIDTNSTKDSTDGRFAKRYLLAGILCMGMFCLFSLSMNTSLALIEMTSNKTVEMNGTTIYYAPEFDWNSKVIGLILSIYAYGHLFSFLVALVVKKFGGIRTHGFSLLFSGIINVLYPFIVRLNFHLFLFIRIIEGVLDNFTFLSIFEIWSKWAPKAERSKLLSIQFTGSYLATAAIFPISGYLAYLWHWPSTYYFAGSLTILVSSIMLLLFSNEPSTDRHISEKEREYLMQELEGSIQKEVTYPWKQIFTSRPLWVLFAMKFSYICALTFISLCLPHYVKDMTNMEIHNVGVLSGIPNILGIITVPICGWLADYTQNKNLLNATQMHKIYTFIGMVLGAGCLFVIALIQNTNFTINIILLIIFKVLLSLSDLVTNFVPLFLAPNHPSLIAAIISYSFFLGSTFVPMLIGYVVTSHDPYEWSIFLSSLAAILLIGGLTFIFFGSSEAQPWSKNQNEPDREQNTENLL